MRFLRLALAATLCASVSVPASAQTVAITAPVEDTATAADAVAVPSPEKIALLEELTYRKSVTRENHLVRWIDELGSYYANPDADLIWVRDGRLTPRARALMDTFSQADEWGLDPADYEISSAFAGMGSAEEQARAELDFSLMALTYAYHAHGGRIDPRDLSLWYDMPPRRADARKLLDRLAATDDVALAMHKFHPSHPQFEALRQAYLDIIKPERVSNREPVETELRPEDVYLPQGPSITRGQRHAEQVPLLRKRLQVPARSPEDETLYDQELMLAVNDFMRSVGWRRKHVFDYKVRNALNEKSGKRGSRSAQVSKTQLLVNMEKWRWLKRDLGDLHIWNNLPSYETLMVKNGKTIHRERIIIGKNNTQTPVFSDYMTHVIFKPNWGVPPSIKIRTLLPRLAGGDYDVLRRRGMKIALNGRMGIPRNIRWASTDIRNIPIVQGPGPANPLGDMKFMFPNKHAVYMHDTNSKGLFNTSDRRHSHGCIRVRDPKTFAKLILRERLGWDRSDVMAQLSRRAEDNHRVDLPKSIPVHNVYFTVWAEGEGFRTYKDIYSHDKRIEQALLRGKSTTAIAASDPARIQKRENERMAKNARSIAIRPKVQQVAQQKPSWNNNSYYGLGGPSWYQPQASNHQKRYRKKRRDPHALVRPFWQGD